MKASDALVTIGLGRKFGARWALQNLSLRVRSGEVYGFLGPNGAGKTTAIRCMMGLITPTAGSVSIFGETDPVGRLKKIGSMVETPAFHDFLTGRENLALSAAYAGVEDSGFDSVLEDVGLAARADDRVGEYSLGMKQRLGLARALIGDPELLILDEPTNGMDPRGIKQVRDLLVHLSTDRGVTIFVSSHLLAEVQQMCTRVGILHEGLLVSECLADGDLESHYLSATGGRQP